MSEKELQHYMKSCMRKNTVKTIALTLVICFMFSMMLPNSSVKNTVGNIISSATTQEKTTKTVIQDNIKSYIKANGVPESGSPEIRQLATSIVQNINSDVMDNNLSETDQSAIEVYVSQYIEEYVSNNNLADDTEKSSDEMATNLVQILTTVSENQSYYSNIASDYQKFKDEAETTSDSLNQALYDLDSYASLESALKEFKTSYNEFTKKTDLNIASINSEYLVEKENFESFVTSYNDYTASVDNKLNDLEKYFSDSDKDLQKEVNESIHQVRDRLDETDKTIDVNNTSLTSTIALLESSLRSTALQMDENNTSATESIENLSHSFRAYAEKNDATLKDLDKSIYTLEDNTVSSADFSSFKRDTGETISTLSNNKVDTDQFTEYQNSNDSAVTDLLSSLGDLSTTYSDFVETNDVKLSSIDSSISLLAEGIEDLDESKVDNSVFSTFSTNTNTDIEELQNKVVELSEELESTKSDVSNFSTELEGTQEDLAITKTSLATTNSNVASISNRLSETDMLTYDKVYPVGSVYMSLNATSPETLFGGTWERISDTFLMAAGNTYPAGTSGGSNSVRLAANQIPSLGISGTTNASTTGSAGSGMSASSSVSSYGYSDRQGSTSVNGEHDHASMKDNALIYVTTPAGGSTPGSAVSGGTGTPNFWSNTRTSIDGSHSHTVYYQDWYANGISTTVSGLTPHTHTIPALSVNGSYTNNNLQSINVTNKYMTVYMWKRVA